jgi:hypothetical protein
VGVQGDTQNPAFCYRITVTNCGPVTLTNVTVFDDHYGDLTTNIFGSSAAILPVGGSTNYTFKAEIGGAVLPSTIVRVTNTVVATGRSTLSGQNVSAQDSAIAEVRPAGISGVQTYSVDGALTNCIRLGDLNNHVVVTYITVTNLGIVNLLGVTFSSDDTNLCNINLAPIDLPVGSTRTIALCTNFAYVCTNFSITITATANQYSDTNGTIITRDINGEPIVVSAEAPGCVECTAPNAARVTGGGRQDDPLVYPADVRYVTHGGQVGAPFGEMNCSPISNPLRGNPCIHGRWTHVRHGQGGSRGNFQARLFDTLATVCLTTNIGPGGVYSSGTISNGICNPGDRLSGPGQPRAAANKIVFTGVGDWTDSSGRRTPQAVLFRVDIEDRGNPGGSHPHGSKDPADRYRIRIWVLTEAEIAQIRGTGADPYLLAFRTAISACRGLSVRDGVDVPNGTTVFGVRPPNIDDGGELERGKHQIHPLVQPCP